MKCPRCGSELRRSKKDPSYGLCYNCKKKYKIHYNSFDGNIDRKLKTKSYAKKERNILMWILLIFLPPVGILYVWLAKKDFTLKKKGILTAIFSVWFLIAMSMPQPSQEERQREAEALKKEQESTEDESLAKKFGVDVSLIKNIKKSCQDVGMDTDEMKIESASNDGDSCEAQVSYQDYLFDISGNADNTITYIGSGDIPFLQNGNTQNVNDRLPTSSQRTTLMVQSESDVKTNLKSPSTAEFPGHIMESDQWTINKNGDNYAVSSWVDAQNSFGAQIRSTFMATYKWDGSEKTQPELISLNIEE